LWLRATFFAPLLALCDLWAPVRVFVDFFTTRFFAELFFDFVFAAISPSPLVVGSGAYRIRAGFTSAPQKKQNSPCSRFVAAPGSKTPRCNLLRLRRDWIKEGSCGTSEGRTYSAIEKTGQAKSFPGKRFGKRGWSQVAPGRSADGAKSPRAPFALDFRHAKSEI
jgi:hypothetical protein